MSCIPNRPFEGLTVSYSKKKMNLFHDKLKWRHENLSFHIYTMILIQTVSTLGTTVSCYGCIQRTTVSCYGCIQMVIACVVEPNPIKLFTIHSVATSQSHFEHFN